MHQALPRKLTVHFRRLKDAACHPKSCTLKTHFRVKRWRHGGRLRHRSTCVKRSTDGVLKRITSQRTSYQSNQYISAKPVFKFKLERQFEHNLYNAVEVHSDRTAYSAVTQDLSSNAAIPASNSTKCSADFRDGYEDTISCLRCALGQCWEANDCCKCQPLRPL